MNETCDGCGPAVRAVYRVHRDGELYLCRHCASRLWPALSAQGWTISPADEHALALNRVADRAWLGRLLPRRST